MVATVGKCKRVVRPCAFKTWITIEWYNWRKNEGEGYKRLERMHLHWVTCWKTEVTRK